MIFGSDQDALMPPTGTSSRSTGYDPDALVPPSGMTTSPNSDPDSLIAPAPVRHRHHKKLPWYKAIFSGPGDPPPGYYYPQMMPVTPGYYPGRGPGGLPTDRATVDTRVYIPAQYEHLQIHPGMAMAIVMVGVLGALVISKHRKP